MGRCFEVCGKKSRKRKVQEHKRKTGEELAGNRQKKKPPAMKAEILQPKRISRPSFQREEPFHISFYFWCITRELVPQKVPNLLYFTIMQKLYDIKATYNKYRSN